MPEPTAPPEASSSSSRSTTLLVNSRAGRRGRPNLEKLSSIFGAAGVHIDPAAALPEDLVARLDALRKAGVTQVAIGGGDGSIASAAKRVAGTDLAILPVPLGTLNTFANRLDIPSVADAARALADQRIECIPTGIVDDDLFLNTATFGVYADLVRLRDRLKPYLTKWPAALVAFAAILARWKTFHLVAHVEGAELRRTTALLWIGMGWNSFPRVTDDPGSSYRPDLEIVVLRPRTRWGSMRLLVRMIRYLLGGRHPTDDPGLEVFHARHCIIEAPRSIGVTLDGEAGRLRAPIFVAVQERALRVFVGGGEEQ